MSSITNPAMGYGQPSPDWELVDTLGVVDVVMTILRARETTPSATAATVSRERHANAFHVRVCLLKDSPAPPEGKPADPGRTGGSGEVIVDFVARQLGQDLVDAFGNSDVIILK